MGALALIEAALKRARGTKTPQQLRKQDLLEALETSEEELLGRGSLTPQETAMRISGGRLGELLRSENIGFRAEPNLPAYSSRAHFDATGGQQLPFLKELWSHADPMPRGGVKLRGLRMLDMNEMPADARIFGWDPFMYGEPRALREGYGLYRNAGEGLYLTETPWGDTDMLDRSMPSFAELLRNSDLRRKLNMSGYVPRKSELFRKPLILAKKHGGSVK